MPFDLAQLLMTAMTNTLSGLIQNIFYIALFIWAVRFLSRQIKEIGNFLSKEIKELGKNIPEWIATYFKYQKEQTKLLYALEDRKKQ